MVTNNWVTLLVAADKEQLLGVQERCFPEAKGLKD